MNLSKLFEIQNGLRNHIGYAKEDKLEKMFLAFIVEVGECANEWRGFKYWSQNQEPKEKLLEEYADGFHFVIDIGIELLEKEEIKSLPTFNHVYPVKNPDIVNQFKDVIRSTIILEMLQGVISYVDDEYRLFFQLYLGLGEMLGFTWDQIEQAYLEKNKENHERQNNGY
ncbi:dUTP diphosphatase [Alkalihalophilus lindianensis]|uniref:dUTP diphosphatase n=1 Tax=Alkalihalophilus lindianensis TaxID=1630542 RepID=A0ABU3X7F3_9BACI|nr:dUTP diphosphatase [Alkalihalophilus lindianensis]MDV2683758.1 dUTP diphosphatase [Alkalihalophilus lindianensis]MDV2683824.1 dUTP diphosphatase [Alkalihalophilus lindianensis]